MILALWSLTFLGQAIAGQVQAPATRPQSDGYERVTIEIHPAAPPVPALKYRLMPEVGEQIAGNAATQYMIAVELMMAASTFPDDALDVFDAEQLDKARATAIVQKFSPNTYRLVELASTLDRCDWGLPLHDRPDLLLPHLNRLRHLSIALGLRIRLEIADGKLDNALGDLRTGFTMAHHISQESVLVQGLVASGIDVIFFRCLKEFQQAQGAPNLYWALANLPNPMVDQLPIVQIERSLFFAKFPELRGRKIEQLEERDYRILFRHMADLPDSNNSSVNRPVNSIDSAVAMVSVYERAKHQLLEQGQTLQQIDQLPVHSVLGTYLLSNYLKWADEMDKWAGLPYWQAREGMQRTVKAMREQDELQGNPLAQLIPNVNRAILQFARAQRMEAEAQCVEGLRAFATTHDGKLPATLDELVYTPAPVDPITGKPFGYEGHGTSATWSAIPIPGESVRYPTGRIIQIIVK